VNAKLAIPVIWALAAALFLRLLSAWDELPSRVAVHFGISMQPNGWRSKRAMAWMVLLVVGGQAALATWLIMNFGQASGMIAPVQLAVTTVLVCVFWQMISFNLSGQRFRAIWIVMPLLLMLGLIAFAALGLPPHSPR
jgi:Protein of unknown function (DUF1648)